MADFVSPSIISFSDILPIEDQCSPYFLHHSNHHGSVIDRSFLLGLSIRNKIGFVNGAIKTPIACDPLNDAWIQCNNFIVPWLLHLISPPIASTDYVFHFLNGLNDTYSALRSKIVIMKPFPSLDEVYNLAVERNHKRVLESRLVFCLR
ncbi:hypothetical protein NMG60_11005407 [Bertholletia excelsa]